MSLQGTFPPTTAILFCTNHLSGFSLNNYFCFPSYWLGFSTTTTLPFSSFTTYHHTPIKFPMSSWHMINLTQTKEVVKIDIFNLLFMKRQMNACCISIKMFSLWLYSIFRVLYFSFTYESTFMCKNKTKICLNK